MRIRVQDRIIIFVAGLILLLAGLGLLLFGMGVITLSIDPSLLAGELSAGQRAIVIAVSVVIIAIGVYAAMLLFRSKQEKGFIMQQTEFGDMSISMQALESMVKKVVDTHEELNVTSTSIHNTRDGIVVSIRILLANGVNIPLTVNALQKQIKHYITSCSGVDVKEIRVIIETNHQSHRGVDIAMTESLLKADAIAATEAAQVAGAISESAQVLATEPESKQEEKPSMHQRIFSHAETPQIVPMPPQPEKPDEEAQEPEEPNEPEEPDEPQEPDEAPEAEEEQQSPDTDEKPIDEEEQQYGTESESK